MFMVCFEASAARDRNCEGCKAGAGTWLTPCCVDEPYMLSPTSPLRSLPKGLSGKIPS